MANKHNASDLAQMQSLPLDAKIEMTKRRIREWYEHWGGQVYVSFSGGKDSTVLKHIVDSIYDDVPSVFVNTGLEYPEIQRFVRDIKNGQVWDSMGNRFNPDIEILMPEMRFDKVIKEIGYPVISKEVAKQIHYARQGSMWAINNLNGVNKKGEEVEFKKGFKKYLYLTEAPFLVSSRCCDIMKKNPIHKYERITKRKAFVGTMASESKRRMQGWMKTGCNAFDSKKPKSQPMAFWTEQDVLEYIVKFNVPYASVYGQIQEEGMLEGQMYLDGYHEKLCTSGVDRTGCMFCMFGCHLDKLGENGDKNRFQVMKETHPKQYAYCMKSVEEGGLGIKQVLEYIGVPYE